MRTQAEQLATNALGRTVQIEKISLSPWSLEAQVFGVSIKSANGQQEALRVERLYVNTSIASVWRLAPVVEQVSVDGLTLRVARVAEAMLPA